MPRDYEEDYSERRANSSSGTKTVLIILGVVGGLMLLGVIGCVGFFGYFFMQGVGQVKGIIGSTTTAESFMQNLQNKNIDGAYQITSAGYKAKMNRTQFEEFLKKNPLTMSHVSHTSNRVSLPDGKKQPVATMSFTLYENANDVVGEMDDDEDDDTKTKSTPKKKATTPPPAPATGKTLSITLKLIEENGQWVVDDVTIP